MEPEEKEAELKALGEKYTKLLGDKAPGPVSM